MIKEMHIKISEVTFLMHLVDEIVKAWTLPFDETLEKQAHSHIAGGTAEWYSSHRGELGSTFVCSYLQCDSHFPQGCTSTDIKHKMHKVIHCNIICDIKMETT